MPKRSSIVTTIYKKRIFQAKLPPYPPPQTDEQADGLRRASHLKIPAKFEGIWRGLPWEQYPSSLTGRLQRLVSANRTDKSGSLPARSVGLMLTEQS